MSYSTYFARGWSISVWRLSMALTFSGIVCIFLVSKLLLQHYFWYSFYDPYCIFNTLWNITSALHLEKGKKIYETVYFEGCTVDIFIVRKHWSDMASWRVDLYIEAVTDVKRGFKESNKFRVPLHAYKFKMMYCYWDGSKLRNWTLLNSKFYL